MQLFCQCSSLPSPKGSAMPTDNVIVTNVTALKAKYGSAYGK